MYADWIDACDAVAKETEGTGAGVQPAIRRPNQPQPPARAGLAPGEKYTAEDDGFIDDDGADADEADYADED